MKIQDLVAPLTKNEFLEKYFERAPYLSTKNAFCLKHATFNLEWLFTTLRAKNLPMPILDMADGKSRIAKKRFSKEVTVAQETVTLVDYEKALPLFNKKQIPIILQAAEQWHPELAAEAASLIGHHYGHMGINIYCTPAGARTFPKHFDTHDVFLVQTFGSKTWNVWNPHYVNPVRGDKYSGDSSARPDYTFTLKAGDILYIPRGFPHEASETLSTSIHLTFGLSLLTAVDVLQHLANQPAGSSLRAALFLEGCPSEDKRALQHLIARLTALLHSSDFRQSSFDCALQKFGMRQANALNGCAQRQRTRPVLKYLYCDTQPALTIATPRGVFHVDDSIAHFLAAHINPRHSNSRLNVARDDVHWLKCRTQLKKLGLTPGDY